MYKDPLGDRETGEMPHLVIDFGNATFGLPLVADTKITSCIRIRKRKERKER